MKKVGIMSMQRIINYGSFLQAYALSNTIKNLGHEVEFVDFKIKPCAVKPARKWTTDDFSGKDLEMFIHIQEAENHFKNEILKEIGVGARNERPNVDTLVIGSDEVFNCLQNNCDVGYSLELFGKDNRAEKIISYAASCGSTTYEELCNYKKDEEVAELLNKFSSISIRDENSKDFVKNLSNIEPINHLDPVLIYDFNDVIKDNIELDNYIIAYGYSFNFTDEECNYIKEFARRHNKKILSFTICSQRCADVIVDAHPLEILAYFKKADFVVTNTFHGTIFSIKSHTPFVSFTRNYNTQKLTDLLNRLELKNRKVDSLCDLNKMYEENIDFSKADQIIEKEKNRSIEYLKSAI